MVDAISCNLKPKDAEQVAEVLNKIAKRKGTLITSVAMAYVMHKAPYVFPICGGRKIEHLKGHMEVLSLELDAAGLNEIEEAYPFGFPTQHVIGRPECSSRSPRQYFVEAIGISRLCSWPTAYPTAIQR